MLINIQQLSRNKKVKNIITIQMNFLLILLDSIEDYYYQFLRATIDLDFNLL